MLPSELLMVRVTDGLAGLKADPESREKLGAHQGSSTSCLWLCPRLSYKVGLYHALFNGVPDDMRRFYELPSYQYKQRLCWLHCTCLSRNAARCTVPGAPDALILSSKSAARRTDREAHWVAVCCKHAGTDHGPLWQPPQRRLSISFSIRLWPGAMWYTSAEQLPRHDATT